LHSRAGRCGGPLPFYRVGGGGPAGDGRLDEGAGTGAPARDRLHQLGQPGGRQLRFMTSEGMLIPFAADRGLVELARELAAELRAETGRELLSAWEPLHYLPT